MFRLDGISLVLNANPVLSDLTFSLDAGKMHVIVGPNGAGKSTLLKVLTGELTPGAGLVLFNDKPLCDVKPERLSALRAVLPQSSHLSFPFTVYEVVAMGLRRGVPKAMREMLVLQRLNEVGMSGFEGRYFQQLSGGEQQRVQLARVLTQIGAPMHKGEPRFLFLDEPISNLDMAHQQRILEIARDFADAGGGVFVILHDINLAARFADRLVILADGRIAAEGPPSDVLNPATLERVWDVEIAALPVPGRELPVYLPQSLAGVC